MELGVERYQNPVGHDSRFTSIGLGLGLGMGKG